MASVEWIRLFTDKLGPVDTYGDEEVRYVLFGFAASRFWSVSGKHYAHGC